MNQVTGTGCTSVDIGVNANLVLVDKFCYLDDMFSVNGCADVAVKARIQIGRNKFRQLAPLLTNKDVSLTVRRRLYSSCVQSKEQQQYIRYQITIHQVTAVLLATVTVKHEVCTVQLHSQCNGSLFCRRELHKLYNIQNFQ